MTVLPIFLLIDVMTVQRAGMFTPAANVSVANTTYTHRANDAREGMTALSDRKEGLPFFFSKA
jgi:hypothetical protein